MINKKQNSQVVGSRDKDGNFVPDKVRRTDVYGKRKKNPIDGFSVQDSSIADYLVGRIKKGEWVPDFPGPFRVFSGKTVNFANEEGISYGKAVMRAIPSIQSGCRPVVTRYVDKERRFTTFPDAGLVVTYQPAKALNPNSEIKYLYVKIWVPDNEKEPLVINAHDPEEKNLTAK